jgi:inhibitor of KinA sporulation pathway (predicted exonuclease)
MRYIIFDLEATCWDQGEKKDNETIEIGAVMVDDKKEIVDEFSQFIKPTKYPILSDFCKNLTSIRQEDVDDAPLFPVVIEDFKSWIGVKEQDYILCSWGFYDRKQFEADCALHNLDVSWIQNHISLKHQHGQIKHLKRAIGMQNALALEGLSFEGTHHRGIDDARNITKIFIKYFESWDFQVTL